MLKIIKYLSYNKNKSKKNYIKCTKFKVLTNFMTNFYLLGIQKVQKLKMMKEGSLKMMKKDRDDSPQEIASVQTGETGGQRDRDSTGQTGRQEVRGTAIPEGQVRQVMEKDRDLFSPTSVFSNKCFLQQVFSPTRCPT
jgi:hypothetical protein